MREIDPGELRQKLANEPKSVLLVDVRLPWEHETAHLPGDLLMPLHELPARADELQPAPGQTVVFYCHHGMRSLQAAGFVAQMRGLQDVASLRGGIDAWSRLVDPSVPRY